MWGTSRRWVCHDIDPLRTMTSALPGHGEDMSTVVSAHGLRKHFGRSPALDGLDLEVLAGEVHGFLGPNGAGKTTTLRILLGLLRADAGEARVFGQDPWHDAVELHRRMAYVPGDVALWPNLTGGEIIDLLGRLHGGLDRRRRAELIDLFALDPTRKTRSYSRGNSQKVALVAALASDADLLLLDEPASGLDPLMEAQFRTELRGLRDRGRTVLLSSHVLAEVEAVCDRVTIIRDGRSVESGTMIDLRHLTRTSLVAQLAEVPQGFARLAGVHNVLLEDHTLHCEVDAPALDEVMRHLSASGIRSLISRPPTLEELFLRHYVTGRGARPAQAVTP